MTPRRTCPFGPVLLTLSLAPACGDSSADPSHPTTTTPTTTTTDDPTTTATTSSSDTTSPELPACSTPTAELHLPGEIALQGLSIGPGGTCTTTLIVDAPRIVELYTTAGALRVDDRLEDEPGWLRPRELAGTHTISIDNPGPDPLAVTLELRDHGPTPTPSPLLRDRSLVWTQPALVEDPAACRLACVLAAISADGHGGALVRQWFDRFATTIHSERLGPRSLLDEFAMQAGPDPTTWDLNSLPFIVTAVHNRLDLRTAEHCGELRLSFASIHPIFRPFHLIFLFAQPPVPEDISPSGTLHCAATALRWARLGELAEPEFIAAARALIAEHLTLTNFLAAETNEFTIAPWEWRQWFLVDPQTLDNRPLFETVDIPRLNTAGPERDAFLAWAETNADALTQRRLLIPEEFRSPSARANQGTPWVPLQLTPALDAAHPDLRRNLEIVGCPACHATDAEFVQTLPTRTFSPFYDKELDARALHFEGLYTGTATTPPFGPLQPTPLLPP